MTVERRGVVKRVVPCLILCAILMPLPAEGIQRAQRSSLPFDATLSSCSESRLFGRADSFDAQLNLSLAVSTAQASTLFSGVVGNLSPYENVTFDSAFLSWTYSNETCVVTASKVGVVFDARTDSETVSTLIVYESPGLTTVLSVDPQSAARGAGYASGLGLWSGYQLHDSGTPSGWWDVPSASAGSNHCNATELLEDFCEILFWIGQSAEQTGSSGIAQTGVDVEDLCQFYLLEYICNPLYYLFYDFYPANFVNTFPVSPGDTVAADSVYSSGVYYENDMDYTSGRGTTESENMSMGGPSYAEYIGEDPPWEVAGVHWHPVVPNFGSVVFDGLAIGDTTDLDDERNYSYPYCPNIDLRTLFFGGGPCYGDGYSCFKEVYT